MPAGFLHVVPLLVAAHASYNRIPTGNGFGTAVFNVDQRRPIALYEHVFQRVSSTVTTRNLLYDAYFGMRAGTAQAWLTGTPIDAVSRDAGLIETTQRFGGLRVTTTYFAPFAVSAPALFMTLAVQNDGTQPVDDVHVFSLHNLRVGDGDGTGNQRVDWNASVQGYVQRGNSSGRILLIRSLTPPALHTVTPQNPFSIVSGGGLFPGNVDTSGNVNDLASGFQYDFGTLAPGETRQVAIVIAYDAQNDLNKLTQMTNDFIGGRSIPGVIDAERAQWQSWLAQARMPAGLSSDEAKLYRQQLTVLRMAQSREPNTGPGYMPYGQMVASMRPGMWDISWVRDACYAIVGLSRAGMVNEAGAALEFMLRASVGNYQQFVGREYRLSIVRYFGQGVEESDSNQNGPNIEFDGFGMFLWALSEYIQNGGSAALANQYWPVISAGIADVLVYLIESDTKIITADSSIWESHWYNGGRQHYAFTTLFAIAGLERAAAIADTRDPLRASVYRSAVQTLREGVTQSLVTSDQILRPSIEQPTNVDGSVVEAFNFDIIDPKGPIAENTFAALRDRLFLSATGHGFKRNELGDAYDNREWVVVDMRIATALWRAGRMEEAEALYRWVRDQALLNYDLIPEQYHETTADYWGEVPMAGFGAGAFIITSWERAAASNPPTTDGGVDGGGNPASGGGCSCTTSGTGAQAGTGGLLLGALVVLLGLSRAAARRKSA